MIGVSRAALAAALLGCALPMASAQEDSHWLLDARTGCAVYDANAHAGDTVRWSGACLDGYADGVGTAAFSAGGKLFESFTGNFARGVAQDGHVSVAWGDGWTYEGNSVHGLFNGAGALVNDKHDRFEGNWVDGQMSGHGTVVRANGERYDGQWKNDLPNGSGMLTRADGSTAQGTFVDGHLVATNVLAAAATDPAPIPAASVAATPEPRPTPVLAQASAPPPESRSAEKPAEKSPLAGRPRGFESLSGKTLTAVDGSRIALTMIEGGIERQITAAGGSSQKTTFTFMNDRLGTVVEDGGAAAGANVTGFFRVTDNGVEVRYADGRAEMLTASSDGGLLMSQIAVTGDNSCRSWYPDGHIFSEEEKKAALAAYASKLGLPSPVAVKLNSCAPAPASLPEPKPAKPSAKAPAHAAYQPKAPKLASLETVAVRESAVHTIDPPLMPEAAADAPIAGGSSLSAALSSDRAPKPGERDASRCLKVESDGHDWGFRNACGFSVQFSYCALEGGGGLNDCGRGGVTGSVAANGFGALSADRSFSEVNANHDFRWVACDGGAGEVIAHLDHADPPSGHCERSAPIDTANAR